MKPLRSRKIKILALLLMLLFGARSVAQNNNLTARFDRSLEQGKLSEVERELFEYVVAHPADAVGLSLLAKLRLKQNRLNEARALAAKALTLNAELLSAKLTLADVSIQTGDLSAARSMLEAIPAAAITDSSARLNLAELYAAAGDCGKALLLTENLPLNLKNSAAVPLRTKCFLAASDEKNLSSAINAAKILVRQNPPLALDAAEVLIRAARHREAAEILRPAVAAEPKNVRALLLLAQAEIGLKNFTGAKLVLAQAENIQPATPELFFAQGLLAGANEQPKEAVELLEKALAPQPDNPEFLAQLVINALRANQTGKALRAAARLMELQPDNLDYVYLYGISALQSNNLPKAEIALNKYLANRPNDSRACVAVGLTLAAQPDKLDLAREQMQKCLTLNAANYEAAYQLGLSYKANGEAAKAIEYFLVAVKLAPLYANAWRDLGTVYLQTGAETNARPALEKAAALKPQDAETHFQLSRLYNLIGETELAKKHLDIFQKLKNPPKDGM